MQGQCENKTWGDFTKQREHIWCFVDYAAAIALPQMPPTVKHYLFFFIILPQCVTISPYLAIHYQLSATETKSFGISKITWAVEPPFLK